MSSKSQNLDIHSLKVNIFEESKYPHKAFEAIEKEIYFPESAIQITNEYERIYSGKVDQSLKQKVDSILKGIGLTEGEQFWTKLVPAF